MKKILLASFLLFLPLLVFAATKINLSADKTDLTTDDTLEIHLSVDGEVDQGQIGIEGIEKFDIVGQQSSQQVQIINGDVTSVQEKILSLQAKQPGDFTITAIAKENGNLIKSNSLHVSISKSLAQETKENLLKSSAIDAQEKSQNKKEIETKKDNNDDLKALLTQPQDALSQSQDQNKQIKPEEDLNIAPLTNVPKIEKFSAFNGLFWIEILGIFAILFMIFKIILKPKKP